jgi:hypothetical protein
MVKYNGSRGSRFSIRNQGPPLKKNGTETLLSAGLPIEICGSGEVEECTSPLSPGHHNNVQPSMPAIRQGQPKRQK